jgi:Ni,Fe-hydrogenase I cytochrome b subunit
MKKNLKLKRWVKVLITVIVIATGVLIYSGLKSIGSEASTDRISGLLCIVGWIYLIFGQIGLLSALWEK